MYDIQHCFICRPSDSIVSKDAGIEPRKVATTALAVRRPNHSARTQPLTRLDLIHTRLDHIHTRLDHIHTRLDHIHTRLDLIHTRLDLIHSNYRIWEHVPSHCLSLAVLPCRVDESRWDGRGCRSPHAGWGRGGRCSASCLWSLPGRCNKGRCREIINSCALKLYLKYNWAEWALRTFLVQIFCVCNPGSQLQIVSSIVLICESTSLCPNKLFSYNFNFYEPLHTQWI